MGIYGNKYKQVPLNEVYFGKTIGIQKVFDAFCEIRKACRKKDGFNVKDSINSSTEVLKFNRAMEDEFGFSDFTVIFMPAMAYQAMTLPIGFRLDFNMINPGKYLIASKEGFKYKKEAKYATMVMMSYGIMFGTEFTEEEAFAVFLHEVGHNFASAVSTNLCVLNNINIVYTEAMILQSMFNVVQLRKNIKTSQLLQYLATGALNIFTTTSVFTDIVSYVTKLAADNSVLAGIGRIAKFYIAIIAFSLPVEQRAMAAITNFIDILRSNKINKINFLINSFKNQLGQILEDPFKFPVLAIGYGNENFSDNFPTIYGFGPALTSGLLKLQYGTKGSIIGSVIETAPILNNLMDAALIPLEVIFGMFDPHPTTAARGENQIALLKAETEKSNIDPKMKKRILSDIKSIQDSQKKLMSVTGTEILTDKYGIRKLYDMFLLKLCGGDLMHYFDKYVVNRNGKEMDSGYQKGIENLKNTKLK